MSRYEIQGRRSERGTVARDHVRLASADDRSTASEIADTMAADKFTTWVFEVQRRAGKKFYVLVETRLVAGHSN